MKITNFIKKVENNEIFSQILQENIQMQMLELLQKI